MSSDFYSSDGLLERGSIPLDIDNVHMLLQVEQEQIQKKTFTNWVNAQLAKRRPPSMIRDLFNDFRDGSKLLDLLEVMSGQSINRDKGSGIFQNRSNIEKAISFLKKKSIKLVNINTPDIIDGKPSIILGLIWTIILQYHIEELASCLSFDSRQSSMESLASLDSRSTLSSRSTSSSPVPPKGSPLYSRFQVSAKKALLLWAREQCHRSGCSVSIKDFKASWRSGMVFLAILNAFRPNLIDLSKARTKSNKQNLEEAFHVAETELKIPRLLNPNDVDVRDPDEKSIMTYVAQFLQYSRDVTAQEDEMQYRTPPQSPSPNVPVHYTPAISASPLQQATPDRSAQEVTCWLVQAFDELLEGWDSTEGESYSERYHVFQTFLVSFNEQRRPIMPLLSAMRRTPNISPDQRSLRDAWECLSEKLREYKVELDRCLPFPLDTVAGWLLRTEGALAEEQGDSQDHGCAADEAREKRELLKICLEEMPQQLKIFQSFQNLDDFGNMMVPSDKIEELKRRFTNVRVTAKYHGIKLEYREHRHTVLDLLGQIKAKLCISKRLFISPEAVRVLLQEWDETNKRELPSLLEAALRKLKQISEKYSSKSALTSDYHHVIQQVKQLEENTVVVLEEVSSAKILMGRILSAWDSYIDCLSSLQTWLEQSSAMHNQGRTLMVSSESMSEWGSKHAHLNEVANFLMESTDPQTSTGLAEELWKLNKHWAECVKENTLENTKAPIADLPTNSQDLQYLIRQATLILKEPLEVMAGPLRVHRNHLQFTLRKIKEVNLGTLEPSAECPLDQLQKLRHAIPEVMQTLFEAEQVCAELQNSVSGLDTRLAELLLWEMEARELYEVLRVRDQQQKLQGQDPRAKAVISRGLQLEGQVVTEEQDLQVIVMTIQKTTPIQYLYASAMQKRVQNAVAQSQEAIGLLSSLGTRRDKSRSPPEPSPPSKIFIQAKIMPQHLKQSETRIPTHQSETNDISNHSEEVSVPKIVVQEFREENIMSPSMPNTCAQVVIQIESQTQTSQDANAQTIQDTSQTPQQQPQQDLSKKHEHENQQPFQYDPEQKLEENKEQELNLEQPRPCQDKQEEQDGLETICQFQVKQQILPIVKEEALFKQTAKEILYQQPAPKKNSLSSQELQSRKAQAIKNRPWLQKAAHPEKISQAASQKQDSTYDPLQMRQIKSQLKRETKSSAPLMCVLQHTLTGKTPPEFQVKVNRQTQQQKEQYQSAREGQQEKKQSQDYKKQPHPHVRQIEPDLGTNNKSQIQSYTKSHVINQSEPNIQVNLQSVPQVQIQSRSLVYSCVDSPQPPTTMSQTRISQSQKQLLPQSHSHFQTSVFCGPQLPLHIPAGTTIRPTSPNQAPPPGFIQLPVPSHIQLCSHPQSWAPVRPLSPKLLTTDRPETQGQQSMTQSLPQPQLNKESQLFAHSVCQPQIPANLGDQAPVSPQPAAYPQAISQSIIQVQSHCQQRANVQTDTFSIDQAQNITQPMAGPHQPQPPICHKAQHVVCYQDHPASDPTTLSQSPAYHQGFYSSCQLQAWPQVRPSTQISVQHLQATTQPFLCSEIYPKPQFSALQWAEYQELQNQAIPQQKHPVSQMYSQQIAQGSHSWGYSAAHILPQWPQQGTQISSHAYVVDLSGTQPQISPQRNTQAWTQTHPQMSSQSQVQQSPQKGAYNIAQKEQSLIQQQIWTQPQLQPQPYHQPPSQTYLPAQHLLQRQHHSQSQIQTLIPLPPSPPDQAQSQFSTQNQVHNLQGQSQTQTQTQLQSKLPAKNNQHPPNPLFQQLPPQSTHFQVLSHPVIEIKSVTPSQPKSLGQAELDLATLFELSVQSKGQSSAQLKTKPICGPIPIIATETTIFNAETLQSKKEQTPITLETVASSQAKVRSPHAPGVVSAIEPVADHQVQKRSVVLSPQKPDVENTQQSNAVTRTSSQPTAQSQIQHSVQSVTELKVQSLVLKPKIQCPLQTQQNIQSPKLTKAQNSTQPRVQLSSQTSQPVSALTAQIHVESLDLFTKPSSLDQVPSQAFTEAYVKAQALAKNHFEEAKHCLQAHIMEAISVFNDKHLTVEQASVKEEALQTLDPELLAEFLRAAKGMEAFCTQSQLKEMEFFTQSVQSQWEVCFSADFAEAGQHLETLKQLCGTLSPEDTHHLAQTQLECEKRVHQGCGEVGTTQKGSNKSSEKIPVSGEVAQVIVQKTVEKKTDIIEKQAFVEEITKKEALERYETCKRTLQAHLAKNEQNFRDVPFDLISLKALHTRLQEIQFLRQETELLWSEYANQCSHFSQLSGDSSLEQEKAELQEVWRSQQTELQRRGSSLGAALRQIDSTENHLVDFNDRLDRYLRQSKDITGFSLASTNILKDIKELHDNIQGELDQLSRLDPESSDLDPRECFRLTREVETHKASLDQLRQQVQKSEAAAHALDQFLISLRKVDDDISGVQGTSCTDSLVLQDCRCKLSLIRQSIGSLKEKAPQLDLLLQGARLTVTRDGSPASCLDMVAVLLRSLEEADCGLASQQRGLQKETQSKSFGLRKRITLGELRKLKDVIEKQSLKEPTMPAVQHRLRALLDLEGQLQAQQSEVQSLREMEDRQGEEENLLQDLEMQWEETQRAFFDRKKQYNVLLELLKKLQTCRSYLSTTIQKAEQTISDQASYIGKDNLQRSMAKVCHMKEELAGLGEKIEDMKGACKQLQSDLKKFPDCTDAPFEVEADTLLDSWLDITEKTDSYMDNLRVGLELWEKQLMLGGEVDNWARSKLALLSEGNPFSNEQQVLAMRDEIQKNEENIKHFHKKSIEIQEMLLSQEAPLELQVMETQLRKRMEQVKELFTDCTDVFEEIIAVSKHLYEKIKECRTSVENIQNCLSKIEASDAKAEAQIQDLDADLSSQEENAEAVLKEVGLVSSVASPLVLEELSNNCSSLREAIVHTRDMIHLKREEIDKGLLKVISDERELFEEWFQDLQLSVNECFESPESRSDVETSLQKLTGFLKSEDTERRLRQLNDQLERAKQQVSSQQHSEFINWLKEQQEEVATFRAHCQNRQEQMESLLDDLNRLQKQHESLYEWLQDKEKQSVVPENVKLLFKELQDESVRGVALSELLASIRRQGVRAENILKDGDNLLQRYRNLETRLHKQATAQSVLDKEYNRFNSQAESIRTWISDLTQPLTSPSKDNNTEDMKNKALAVLSCRPEGDSKINSLLGTMERLCELEDIDVRRKHDFCLLVREMEGQWRNTLQDAEEAFNQAETKVNLEKLLDTFQIHTKNLESWIKNQSDILASLGPHLEVEEKLKISEAILSSRPYGESKLHDLKQQYQSISENQGSDGNKRKEICSAVKQAEEQWENLIHDAEVAAKQAKSQAGFEREFKAFKNLDESFQSWMRELRQKLLGLGGHMQFEERWQIVQDVISSKSEGESKLLNLKMQSATLCKQVEKSRKAEVEQMVSQTEQLWGAILETAQQAELQSLLDDFDFQRKNTDSWIGEKQQTLQCVFSHTPSDKRCHTAQAILSSRPDGDFKVNNLRRRGQTLCDYQGADEGQKLQAQQTVKDTENQWRKILQVAQQVEAAAAAEIAQDIEKRSLEMRELDTHQSNTDYWIEGLQQQLAFLANQTKPGDRLHVAKVIMSSKADGDYRLQKLRSLCQSVCSQDLGEQKKQDLAQRLQDSEEQWARLLKNAKQAMSEAERQCALDLQIRNFEALNENIGNWLKGRQENLMSLDNEADLELVIKTSQNILSLKPEGDSKLSELTRHSQSLSQQEEMSVYAKQEVQKAAQDSEELWRKVLQTAENTLLKAEVHYSLSREMGAFRNHADNTKSWIEGLDKQAECMQGGMQGSKAQLEERMKTAQVILSFRSNGESQVMELKRRAQSLCDYASLPEDKRMEAQQIVQDVEIQWRAVLWTAEETHRQMQDVMDRLLFCKFNQDQAEALLAEIQKQASSLPQTFPWPGLGLRRQAIEQAQTLLEQSTNLAPVFSDVCSQAEELFEITQDQVWIESFWTAKEEAIPALLKQLTDVEANLQQGIVMEQQCTLLIEQHEAAQDWLREQIKGLEPAPTDRSGLYNFVNTLKALLQTVDREQREIIELDSAKNCLMSLCTPGGQDAITLKVRYLHELCARSDHEVRQHLTTCERRLEEMDCELARISQELKERAAALQWELRSLDQAFSYSEPQNNIAQLQQHWHSLQNCENSLLDLGVKVHDLYQEVKSATYTNKLPAEIMSLVESLCQQHTSLEFRLSDHQGACSTNTAHYLKASISIMQQWTHSNPSDLVSSVQMATDEVENLQHNLHEALSHQQFLTACLTQDLFEKFKKECLETLEHVDAHKNLLNQSLKENEQRGEQLPDTQFLDMFHVKLGETKSTVVAPPRKNRSLHDKHSTSLPKMSTSVMDELLVQVEEIQTQTLKPSLKPALEVPKIATCEETSLIPSRRKSKCLETEKQLVHTEVESDMSKVIKTHCGDISRSEPDKTSDAKLQQNQDYFKIAPSGVTTVEKNTSVVCPQFVETLLRQKEVLPPRQKPLSPKFPSKYPEQQMVQAELTEVSHGEESKLIPVRRKSKTAILAETCREVAFDSWSTEVDPEDNKTPVSLESSDVLRESKTQETNDEEKDKPSLAKRRLEGQETPMTHIAKTLAESHPHPNSDKSLQSSKEQRVFVEETEPTHRKSNLEVQLALNYSANITPSVDPDDTQQGSNFATKTFIDSPVLSPKRKSEKTELCIVQAFQMNEAESNTSFQFEQSNNESMAQGSLDGLIGSTDSSLKDKGKFSPTEWISGTSTPLQDTIAKPVQDTLMGHEGQNPLEETETTILAEIAVIPIIRKSTCSDISASVRPATMETYNLESNETKKEIESGEATDQEEHELVLTTRSNNLVSYQEHFSKEKAQAMENDQIRSGGNERQAEVLVVESVKLIQNKRKSEGPKLPLEHLTNDQVTSNEKYDTESSMPPSTEQTDSNLAGTELRQTRKDVTRVEPSAGPELLCATETHTDIVMTHRIEKHNSLKLTTAEKNSKDNETVEGDISSEKNNDFQDQDQQEKEKDTVDLDRGGRFLQLLDSSFHEVETCASAHAIGSKADISYSSSKTSDTGLQESEYKAKETPHQTIFQSSERNLDMVSEVQCLISSDTTDVSIALQPKTMVVGTGALEMKDLGKEINTEIDSSTQPLDTQTTDREEYECFTTTSKNVLVTPESFYKEETLVMKASDSQIAEATSELMYFRGQPELVASVINEKSPDKTESQNLSNSDKNKIQSQCGEAPSRTQDERRPFSTSVVGLTQISLTKQKSECPKNVDEMKASGTKTENGHVDNQTIVQQHSEVAKETKVQILEDQTLQGMKVATLILNTKEKCMGEASYLTHNTCALSHYAKENEEDISAIPLKSCQESEHRVRGSPQQTITQSSERDLDTASKVQLSFSSDSIDLPKTANYILDLWENTDKIEKRYLILDVPAAMFSQISEIELNQPDTESRGKHVSNRDSSAVSTLSLSQEEKTDLTEIHLTENENLKLRGTVSKQKESEQKASQEIYEKLKESYVHEVKEIKEEKFAHKEPDCILDLDITSSLEVTDNTCVTGDETVNEPAETIFQEDITEKTSAEIKAPGLEAAMANMTELIEISFNEQDQIDQIDTRLAKECSIPVKHPTLLTHKGDAKSVNFERSQILTKVRILQLDIQSSQEESDPTSTEEEKETDIDIDRTLNQIEKYIVSFKPEEVAFTMSEIEMQASSSQIVGSVAQADSVQLTSFGYESVHPQESRVIEIGLNDKDIGHREKEAQIELLRTENEKAGPGKRYSFMKNTPEMATETPNYFSSSLGEKSEDSGKTHKELEEKEVQQASADGQENMFVKVEEPEIDGIRAESHQTDSNMSQDDSSQPLSSCDADTVLDDKRTSEQDNFNTEVMKRQDIWRTIQERHWDLSQNLNDNSITEKGQQLLILQPDTQVQKTTSVVTIAKMPKTDPNETCIQGERGIEKQDLISLDVYPEEMLILDLKQQAFVEAKKSEIDNKEKSQDYKQLGSGNGALLEVDKDPGVAEQPSKLVIHDTNVGPETFYKNFIENTEIFVSPFEVQIADTEKQLGMVPRIKTDSVKESQDAAIAKIQQGLERIEEAVQETFTSFMSQPSLVQMYKHSKDPKENIGEQQVTETEEITVSAGLQLQTPDDEVKLQTVNLPKVELHKNEPEDLVIPTSHLDLQLSRLASTVFHIKNSPTELNPKAMALQVEEVQVAEAVERSGAVYRLGTKLSDVHVGLRSVQNRMEKSPTVTEAKITQKRVWDELDVWHSRLAALEVEMQDLEKPEEVLIVTEKLVKVQQLYSQVAKQAEQRTTLLSKIHTWLQEHQEMIKSSRCWMTEAESWLAAPCTYTTAKCLRSHVHALQIVLGDASQIRSTLQNFSSVLEEMSQVCDVTALHNQLLEADHRVSEVHGSFTAPLTQLEHAAAEMEVIEKEVCRMENDVAEIETLLSSPETFTSPREDHLKKIEQRIQSMRHTVEEIQKCKPGLCLPEKAVETLTVFNVVEQLQTLLLDLEKKVLALFIQQPSTPNQAKVVPKLQNSISGEEEHGQITVVHFEENILKKSGGSLQTVRQSSEQRQKAEQLVVSEEKDVVSGLGTGQTAEDGKDIERSTDTSEASSSEALSEAVDTVRTQSRSESMESLVNTASSVNVSQSDFRPQHRCVIS